MSQILALIQFQTHQIIRKYERLDIYIDGNRVGDIGNYDDLHVHVNPGTHLITSQGKWGPKAYPLYITVAEKEIIEIFLQPLEGNFKFQFVIDTKIPVVLPKYRLNTISNTLAWDLNSQINLVINPESQLTFNLKNSAYPDALQFVFDLQERRMEVYSSQKTSTLLYEATFHRINSLVYPFSMQDHISEHTFYRSDGSLLGFLSLENGRWIIASNRQERIAEICAAANSGERLISQDFYLLSIQDGMETLAHTNNVQDNALCFEQFGNPDAAYQEILFLAFVGFSALAWAIPAEYTPQRILETI